MHPDTITDECKDGFHKACHGAGCGCHCHEPRPCEHKFTHGGVKYEVRGWPLPGTGAKAVTYFDWFYCEKCLTPTYVKLDAQTSSYDRILFNATPKPEEP